MCYGVSWIGMDSDYGFSLQPLLDAHQKMSLDSGFFNAYFKRLAGSNQLQIQVQQGMTEQEIRATWEPELGNFKELRKKYLIYD